MTSSITVHNRQTNGNKATHTGSIYISESIV